VRLSRASLEIAAVGGRSRVARAAAGAPQRWAVAPGGSNGWAEVRHQYLGDGIFAGERCTTSIVASSGTSAVVRGVSATSLRAGAESVAATRLRTGPASTLLFFPGALIPHAGANHTSSVRIEAAQGSRVLACSTVTVGRSGMGESGVFHALRLRTVVKLSGQLALFEDARLDPGGDSLSSKAMFGEAQAYLSAVIVGDWREDQFAGPAISPLARTPLRSGGSMLRGLFGTLGEAQECAARLEDLARTSDAECIRARGPALTQAIAR